MDSVRESLKKINCNGALYFNEPMAKHSTFRTGGAADIFFQPYDLESLKKMLFWSKEQQIHSSTIGGGANILVSDTGVRGLVIDTTKLKHCKIDAKAQTIVCSSGLPISTVSAKAANASLSGLEFIFSMPGSTGGAVYMNARCYGSELREVLVWVRYLDQNLVEQTLLPTQHRFDYKDTPFMKNRWIITEACFNLQAGNKRKSWKKMHEFEADRRSKGHFDYPCAGSVFKNNRAFGAPSGQIIDSLGLRGTRCGGAQISERHANIIVNVKKASSKDIWDLMILIKSAVKDQLGFELEEEVVLLGDWQ